MLLLQVAVVSTALAALGLVGLGIDVIRHQVDPLGTPPRWPWGTAPPTSWSVMTVVSALAGALLGRQFGVLEQHLDMKFSRLRLPRLDLEFRQ